MKDKNIEAMLDILHPVCGRLTIVEANIERAAKKEEVLEVAKRLEFSDIHTDNIENALENIATNTIVCGSFYIMNSPRLQASLQI